MKKTLRQLLLLIPFLLLSNNVAAQDNSDSDTLRASLLTCSPGQEIYEYYGHTALLIRNVTKNLDVVFNYGLFNSNTPHFVWRFMRGETDYQMGATYLLDFLPEYAQRGSFVRELQLNLTQKEVHRLFESLLQNCEPQNSTYHYDFFYDNCATRVRNQIINCLDGKLIYTTPVQKQSLRDIVHQYSKNYAWSTFGQDLLLGAEADRKASREIQQFAPLYLERDFVTARIKQPNGQMRPLVKQIHKLVTERSMAIEKGFPISPLCCSIILFLVTVAFSIKDFRKKRPTWILDLILLGAQGLTGCVITFMFFFSQHPTVNSNWLIILFNPLPLIFLYWTIRSERQNQQSRYHQIARFVLAAFIVFAFIIPQHFGFEILLLALCLITRSQLCHTICSKTPQRKNHP